MSLTSFEGMEQFLTFNVTSVNSQEKPFFMTAIYASPDWRQRQAVWNSLGQFQTNHVTQRDAWFLIGDLNRFLGGHKKFGGRQLPWVTYNRDFRDFLDATKLNDLGFINSQYTWSNKRQPPDLILERLDRGLGNDS